MKRSAQHFILAPLTKAPLQALTSAEVSDSHSFEQADLVLIGQILR